MPPLRERIRWLWPGGSTVRIAALGATLRIAGRDEVDSLADGLLSLAARPGRSGHDARRQLVLAWDRLSADARAAALALGIGESAWALLISDMLGGADPSERLAAARMAPQLGNAATLRALVDLLPAADRPLADAIEHALVSVARELAVNPAAGAARRHAVESALVAAIDRYEQHRRSGLILAAIGVANGPSRLRFLRGLLADEAHPAHLALRGVIRRNPDPAMRPFAILGLTERPIASACMERLAGRAGVDEHEATLGRWHLLRAPIRRAAIGRLHEFNKRGPWWLPDTATMARLSPEARRGQIEFTMATLGGRARETAMAPLMRDPDPGVRLAACRTLAVGGGPRSTGLLHEQCSDADGRVAHSAATALLAVSQGDSLEPVSRQALLGALTRSPHEQVRALANAVAAADAERPGFQSIQWPGPRELVGRAVAGQPLGADAHALASAVMQLARRGDAQTEELLRSARALPDPRVRANAVDAIVHLARGRWASGQPQPDPSLELLIDGALDPEHRIRANCARGLLLAARGGDCMQHAAVAGRQTVCAMLSDQRPMHRIAALWLTERLAGDLAGTPEVLDRVHWLMRDDHPAVERQRAQRTARRLLSEVRRGWTRPGGKRKPTLAMEAAA